MKFTKMHGCGNDYVYVNGMREQIASDKKPEMVRKLSDRHFGIGADGRQPCTDVRKRYPLRGKICLRLWIDGSDKHYHRKFWKCEIFGA